MVSASGVDEPSCLSDSSSPCRTISYVVAQGVQTICLATTLYDQTEYIIFDPNNNIPNNSLSIYGNDNGFQNCTLHFEMAVGNVISVSIYDAQVKSSVIGLSNIDSKLSKVTLENSRIVDESNVTGSGMQPLISIAIHE